VLRVLEAEKEIPCSVMKYLPLKLTCFKIQKNQPPFYHYSHISFKKRNRILFAHYPPVENSF